MKDFDLGIRRNTYTDEEDWVEFVNSRVEEKKNKELNPPAPIYGVFQAVDKGNGLTTEQLERLMVLAQENGLKSFSVLNSALPFNDEARRRIATLPKDKTFYGLVEPGYEENEYVWTAVWIATHASDLDGLFDIERDVNQPNTGNDGRVGVLLYK